MSIPTSIIVNVQKSIAKNFIQFHSNVKDKEINEFFILVNMSCSIEDEFTIADCNKLFLIKEIYDGKLDHIMILNMIRDSFNEISTIIFNELRTEDLHCLQQRSYCLKSEISQTVSDDILFMIKNLELISYNVAECTNLNPIFNYLTTWLCELYQIDNIGLKELIARRFKLTIEEYMYCDSFNLFLIFAFEHLDMFDISYDFSHYLESIFYVEGEIVESSDSLPTIDTLTRLKKDFYYALVQDINAYSNEPKDEDDFYDPTPCIIDFFNNITVDIKKRLMTENPSLVKLNECHYDSIRKEQSADDSFFNNLTNEFENIARCCLRKNKIDFYEKLSSF